MDDAYIVSIDVSEIVSNKYKYYLLYINFYNFTTKT